MPRGIFNSAPRYAIARHAYGWVVRLTRNGGRIERSFSDRAHGGEAKALRHATQWRNEMVRQHPPPARRDKAQKPRVGTGSIPGVTAELDAQGQVKRWRAKTYVSKGRILQKTFGVAAYGSAAQALAIDERHRQLCLVEGRAWTHPAERKLRSAAPSTKRPPPVPARPPEDQIVRTTNTTGYPGVVRRQRHWTAQTAKGGKWVSQSFRIDLYGEEVALILAVWARLDQLRGQA